MAKPPRISERATIWHPNTGQDTAKYLVDPGDIDPSRNTQNAGNMRHSRPWITAGTGEFFIFPTPTEGFRRTGQATLGIHHYIGDDRADVQVVHREEGRIELRGTFAGVTAAENMLDCIDLLLTEPPENGLTLYVPGVFEKEEYVAAESWEFDHDPEDQTHSIPYTITFIRTGEGKRLTDKAGEPGPPQPISGDAKGTPTRTIQTRDGMRTLKSIAAYVYHDADMWFQIVELNRETINRWQSTQYQNSVLLPELPAYQLPTFLWPLGTTFVY